MVKKSAVACLCLLAALSFSGRTLAAGEKAEEKKVEKTNVLAITAKVEAIDQATRKVTVKGPKGNVLSFVADPAVKNLAQVKTGDEVVVNYYESLVLRVLQPGEAAVNEGGAAAAAAKPGEKPAAVAAGEVTVTVSTEAIDTKAGTVTFKGPSGVSTTIPAEDPKNLEKVKVGDRVAITYREALALSVEPAKK